MNNIERPKSTEEIRVEEIDKEMYRLMSEEFEILQKLTDEERHKLYDIQAERRRLIEEANAIHGVVLADWEAQRQAM